MRPLVSTRDAALRYASPDTIDRLRGESMAWQLGADVVLPTSATIALIVLFSLTRTE